MKIEIKAAVLCFNDWAGHREKAIEVYGETPKRYRIALPPGETSPIRLAGRNRWLRPMEVALVPRTAVKFKSR